MAGIQLFSYNLCKRGDSHLLHCEDSTLLSVLNEQLVVMAVSDGCSSAKDSVFAAKLFCKLLDNCGPGVPFDGITATRVALEMMIAQVCSQFLLLQQILKLSTDEMLATLLVAVFNVETGDASVIAIGDGLVVCNGEVTEIDQNNTPNYLGYYLATQTTVVPEYLNEWLAINSRTFDFKEVKDLALSSDGILTFQQKPGVNEMAADAVHYFLLDEPMSRQYQIFERMYNIYYNKYGMRHYDDLGIVRIQRVSTGV
jgi:hypothetical protein